MKKIFYILALFCCFLGLTNNVNATTVEITKEEQEILKQYMSVEEMSMLSDRVKEKILEGNVEAYESIAIATTYYSDNTRMPRVIRQEVLDVSNPSVLALDDRCEIVSTYEGVCETEYKVMDLLIRNVGHKEIFMNNSWKQMPKYKSFDVVAIRWTGGFSLVQNYGNQYTNGNSGNIIYSPGNGNFKIGTNGVGLSQNLVDSATRIENELILQGTCSTGGTIYGTYQHAQANITLATSKSYSFSSSGMGGVLNFTGNAVGIYDDTPGISLSYTC